MSDKNKLYEIFYQFFDITSINGFKNIIVANRKEIKIAWILVILILTSLCIYMVVGNCLNYLNYETKTVIREINEPQSTFPAVVLCNRNLFTNEYSYQYLTFKQFSCLKLFILRRFNKSLQHYYYFARIKLYIKANIFAA